MVMIVSPASGTQLVGGGVIPIVARVRDDSRIQRVLLQVAGETTRPMEPESGSCQEGCELSLAWDNRDLVEGEHEVDFVAVDRHGNEGRAAVTLTVLDAVHIEEIEVTEAASDGLFGPNLEAEVHLYDADSGEFLGCSGANEGLRDVEGPNVAYSVQAWFTKPPAERVAFEVVRSRQIQFVVTEDDDDNRCPTEQNALSPVRAQNDDDLFGESDPIAGAELSGSPALSFPGVTSLRVSAGRPFSGVEEE